MKKDTSGIILNAIRHKKIIYLIVVALVVFGLVGLFRMNRDEFPAFDIKQGLVAAVYPGATAEQVRQQVAGPLEELLFSFSEVERSSLKSYSRDGICYMYVDLTTPASKKDEVWSKIKLKLSTAKLTLPTGVAAIVVLDDFSETSALLIALDSPDKGSLEMKHYAEDLCTRLRAIPELAKATVIGAKEQEIAVTADLDRLASYGMNPASLMLSYTSATLNSFGGTFKPEYANSPIHIDNPVTSEQELEDYIVHVGPDGNFLRLRDVATVQRRYADNDKAVSYNGHTAVIVNVSMRPDNNIVDFGEDVDKVLAEFSSTLPDSVHISRITDQPKVVRTSILGFVRDLFISMLVVILVMLMLFPMRSALIAGSGVPVCTAVTLAVMYATGMQLNTVTLAALIVVLGMIVDDSIITMDGYMDKLGRIPDREKAACASAKELFLPMFLATFAIGTMFFPCKHIIKGYLGDFVQSFPWIIAIALMCSLVYAMLVVPSLEVRFITSGNSTETLLSRLQRRFFDRMQEIYNRAEEFCFRHPALTVTGGFVAVGLGILMFLQLNVQMMPKANRDCFAVEIVLGGNSSFEDTAVLSDSITNILLKDRRIKSVTTFAGESAPRFHCTYSPMLPSPGTAQLIVNTVSNKATVEILSEYEDKYEHIFPEATVHFRQMDYQGTCSVDVMFKGAPVEQLKPFADSLRAYMYTSMGGTLKFIRSDCDDMVPCVEVNIRPDDASRLAVDKTLLSLSLSGIFDGVSLTTLYEDGEKIPVRLYDSAVGSSMNYSDISSRQIPTMIPGVSVPLGDVADVVPSWRYASLPRISGQDAVSVTANMKMGCSQPQAMKQIKAYLEENVKPFLPEGVTIEYAGLSASNDDVIPQVGWSFLAAVAVLFLFLLIHFKKVSISVLTMALSMLCLFGAALGLWLFNMDLSMTAVLGLISLVGIIVRNGIIMFEYAEQLRFERGYSVREAALLAGRRRMRPIFLTSCTTALGVLPMIISGDLLWMPMGLVICFGTLMSIFLIVLVMPVSYWQVFSLRGKDA